MKSTAWRIAGLLRSHRCGTFLVTLLILVFCVGCPGYRPRTIPDNEQVKYLEGGWIAFDPETRTFHRLILEGEGGSYGVSYKQEAIYPIEHWAVSNGVFMASILKDGESVGVTGTIPRDSVLILRFSSKEMVPNKVTLIKESDFESHYRDLKSKMEKQIWN